MQNKVKSRKYLGRKLIVILYWLEILLQNIPGLYFTQMVKYSLSNKMAQRKQTLRTISEINGFLDDLNSGFQTQIFRFSKISKNTSCFHSWTPPSKKKVGPSEI